MAKFIEPALPAWYLDVPILKEMSADLNDMVRDEAQRYLKQFGAEK